MAEDRRRSDTSANGSRAAGRTGGGSGDKDERAARLEQALRANLRRRKAQSRARADAQPPAKASDTPE
jgi:hypothetical protein